MPTTLNRSVFEISRAAEYFSISELTAKTGQPEANFTNVILKELLDNAIDAAEGGKGVPSVKVEIKEIDKKTVLIAVEDNGAGIAPETVPKILNFNTRTSTKQAYVSPIRGAQGNALKTILGIPYAVTNKPTELSIISQGIQHEISIGFDPAGEPRIDYASIESEKKQGTIFKIKAPVTSEFWSDYFLKGYALFNPHIELVTDENPFSPTTNDKWRKVISSDLTSIHWYTEERFRRLVYCYIAESRNGGERKTLKNFITEFKGLSARAKVQQVANRFHSIIKFFKC